MNILFVGVLDIPWSTNVEMKKAFEHLGHSVEAFSYRTVAKAHSSKWQRNFFFIFLLNKFFSLIRRYDWIPAFFQNLYYQIQGRNKMNKILLDEVNNKDYDLVFFAKTDAVNPDVLSEISKKTITWYYFMDPMDQLRKINASRYARCATYTSATFTDVFERFKENNSNSYWMTQGIDTEVFFPQNDDQKTVDVMFAGTKTRKREASIKEIRERGIQVTCYGQGWENSPIYHEELVDCYRSSKIVLNLCREGTGFSVRVFQVLGTGAFLLSEYCPDLERVFQKEKHLDWARSSSELAEKVEYYLNNQEKYETIASKGCTFVYREKNWEKLMDELIHKMQV